MYSWFEIHITVEFHSACMHTCIICSVLGTAMALTAQHVEKITQSSLYSWTMYIMNYVNTSWHKVAVCSSIHMSLCPWVCSYILGTSVHLLGYLCVTQNLHTSVCLYVNISIRHPSTSGCPQPMSVSLWGTSSHLITAIKHSTWLGNNRYCRFIQYNCQCDVVCHQHIGCIYGHTGISNDQISYQNVTSSKPPGWHL